MFSQIISKCHRRVLHSRQRPFFAMAPSIEVYTGHGILAANHSLAALETHYIRMSAEKQSSALASASTECRLAGRAQILLHQLPLRDHLQPVENIMWLVGCAVLWKCVFISILGSLCVSVSALRLALHGATTAQCNLNDIVPLVIDSKSNKMTEILSFCRQKSCYNDNWYSDVFLILFYF